MRNPHELKSFLNSFAASITVVADEKKVHGITGAIVTTMEQTVDTRQRKLVLCWLFGTLPIRQMSIKELTFPQIMAMRNWIDWMKMGQDFIPNPDFEGELRWVAMEAETQYNIDHQMTQGKLIPGGMVDVAVNELGGEVVSITGGYTFD